MINSVPLILREEYLKRLSILMGVDSVWLKEHNYCLDSED